MDIFCQIAYIIFLYNVQSVICIGFVNICIGKSTFESKIWWLLVGTRYLLLMKQQQVWKLFRVVSL